MEGAKNFSVMIVPFEICPKEDIDNIRLAQKNIAFCIIIVLMERSANNKNITNSKSQQLQISVCDE